MPHPHLDDDWRPHAEFDGILRRVERIAADDAIRWRGTAFRFAEPRYAATGDRLMGVGAKMYGMRWNPKGLAATYGATTRETALAETYGQARGYGFDQEDLMPRVLFAFRARLRRVVDLTDGRIRQRLRVSAARMIRTDWKRSRKSGREALTQAIGRAACIAGCDGLLVPSRHGKAGSNLVVFPVADDDGSRLETVHADQLSPGG